MIHALIIATAVLVAAGAVQNVQSTGRAPVSFVDFTVSQERLPAGCGVALANTIRVDGDRVRSGFWAGLPIDVNPWTGTDRRVIAKIRERMDGPVTAPDGPPLAGRQLAQFRLQLADGVDEAYAAVYRQAEPTQPLVIVYGARFSPAKGQVDDLLSRRASENSGILRLRTGSIVVVLHGDGGPCFQAIGAHLKALAQ